MTTFHNRDPILYDELGVPLGRAVADMLAEHDFQFAEFSAEGDDALTPAEWIARVAKHVGRAVTQDPASFRREMVVVGALALAAIESFDRRYPQ